MMTRKQLQRLVIEAICIVAISIAVLLVGLWVSNGKANTRLQDYYQSQFSSILAGSYYTQMHSRLVDENEEITSVYLAYDESDSLQGYIIEVNLVTKDSLQLHMYIGISSDGSHLTGISRIADEENPVVISEEDLNSLCSQMIGEQIPVALESQITHEDVETEDQVELGGLNDGIYYAQALQEDSYGYIDYVEIEVEDGMITRVVWDAMNVDPTTENRSDASLSGAYTISGENWATQSYTLCHELLDLQDPDRLAMKSDGTTEIVPGVTCNIRQAVTLMHECISNSRANYDKDRYISDLQSIIIDSTSGIEIESITNDEGLLFFSFSDSELEEGFGDYENVRQASGIEDVDVSQTDDSSIDQENDGINLVGSEDGVTSGSEDVLTDSVDGLPSSEIRTLIIDVPASQENCSVISSVNIAYKFLKVYLDWLA